MRALAVRAGDASPTEAVRCDMRTIAASHTAKAIGIAIIGLSSADKK